jgi:hypothetical protein
MLGQAIIFCQSIKDGVGSFHKLAVSSVNNLMTQLNLALEQASTGHINPAKFCDETKVLFTCAVSVQNFLHLHMTYGLFYVICYIQTACGIGHFCNLGFA